jgi:predicted Zn-dependent peptidase
MFRCGSADDPAGQGGLGPLTAALMQEGAGSRNALELADAIERLGASIRVTAGTSSSAVTLNVPTARLEQALDLFADIALRPAFPEAELDRLRTERVTALAQWRDQPRAIASVGFRKLLYGAEHPYGRPALGSEAFLRAVTVRDVEHFYQSHMQVGNAAFAVAGDITPAQLIPLLNARFGAWKPAAKLLRPAEFTTTQLRGRRIAIIDKPGAAQSVITVGRVGVPRSTPGYYPIVVMNTLLGGSFTSRLMQNLREAHGYTYGARSYFAFGVEAGPFVAASDVQTEVTDKALAEFMKELRGIGVPATEAEIERARNFVAYEYPTEFQSVSDIAGNLEELWLYGLPRDTFNTTIPSILAVSAADVARAARETIDPDDLLIVIVGDAAKIGKSVRALKLGDVTVLSVDDILGPAPSGK